MLPPYEDREKKLGAPKKKNPKEQGKIIIESQLNPIETAFLIVSCLNADYGLLHLCELLFLFYGGFAFETTHLLIFGKLPIPASTTPSLSICFSVCLPDTQNTGSKDSHRGLQRHLSNFTSNMFFLSLLS